MTESLSNSVAHATMKRLMHTRTFLIALLLACAMPLQGIAATTLEASASVAGVGIDVIVRDIPSHQASELLLQNPDGLASRYAVQGDAQGNGVVSIPGRDAERAGVYTLSLLQDRTAVSEEITVSVLPDTRDLSLSDMTVWAPRIQADGRDNADVSITLRDRYGNPAPARPLMLIASRPADHVEAVTPATDARGTQHFRLSTTEVGTVNLRAVDLLSGRALPATATLTAVGTAVGGNGMFYPSADSRYTNAPYRAQLTSFDVIDGFEIIAPSQMPVNQEAQKITVRAVDRDGRTVEDYVGTVTFTSTDPQATLPNFGTYTFKERDLGEKAFPLVLKFGSTGLHTIRVEDASNPSVRGEVDIQVGGGGTPTTQAGITITSHASDSYINTTTITVEGRGPRFADLIIMGGEQDIDTSTDENGAFSASVPLRPGQRDYTLRVRDDSGRNDSGPIHLIMDQEAPAIETVVFSPEKPEPEENVLVVVTAESGLETVLLSLEDQDIALQENASQPGTYQAFFTAPPTGAHQPTVRVIDAAGNASELRVALGIGSASLPVVNNVRARAGIRSIDVSWNAVDGAESYRIYLGDSPQNLDASIDTASAATGVTLTGLESGKTYVVAVTALAQGKESEQRSQTATAAPLGIALNVQPANGALVLDWSALSSDMPLSAYLLEYGTDANALAEQRLLNAQTRTVTVRDLINGVEYVLRLTPVSVTGERLTDLATMAQGTPSGSGFTPTAGEQLPGDSLHPGASLHPPAQTPVTGGFGPLWIAGGGIMTAGILLRLRALHRAKQSNAFLHAVQKRYAQQR